MDIQDLRSFLVIAKSNNLHKAAEVLHKTPGALSKIIKRLELQLDAHLFERQGRNIVLNNNGERFSQYARVIVHEAEQAMSAFASQQQKIKVNITGPSILMNYALPLISPYLSTDKFEFNLRSAWEGEALNQVKESNAHLAFLTALAAPSGKDSELQTISLDKSLFRLVASPLHPIFEQFPEANICSKQVAKLLFACPTVSPFCGIKRGIGSDGWRDDLLPRHIGYRCDDFAMLMTLVQQAKAVAYVPEFCAQQYGLRPIMISDYQHQYEEELVLCFKASFATGWLNRFIAQFKAGLGNSGISGGQ